MNQLNFRRPSGFSLPELLAALAITLVILTIALPAYTGHQHRVERVSAQLALQAAERCLVRQRTIVGENDPNRCLPAMTRSYRYLLVPALGGFAQGHEWRAEPRGTQKSDRCGTLVLDQAGRRTILGVSAGATACWRGS